MPLTTQITLGFCRAMFGESRTAYQLYTAIRQDDLDGFFDLLEDLPNIVETAMFIAIPLELREATTFDVFVFGKHKAPTPVNLMHHALEGAEPYECIIYHHGFIHGQLSEYVELMGITFSHWQLMPYPDFEEKYLT